MEQRITVDSILDKKFSTVAKGFNQQEVDEYLDQICDEFDRRDAEMNALRQEIAQLKAAQAAKSAYLCLHSPCSVGTRTALT